MQGVGLCAAQCAAGRRVGGGEAENGTFARSAHSLGLLHLLLADRPAKGTTYAIQLHFCLSDRADNAYIVQAADEAPLQTIQSLDFWRYMGPKVLGCFACAVMLLISSGHLGAWLTELLQRLNVLL